MRDIIFRGKRKHDGKWIEGYYTLVNPVDMPRSIRKPKSIIFPITAECNWFNKYFYHATEVLPETVGQFTGLVDKYGTRIFEDDLVYNGVFLARVEFCDGKFYPFNGEDNMFFADECEVINNIHDNPKF